jgi:REP element-mobilizing transposase RayT
MTELPGPDLHFFDPAEEVEIRSGKLPHWMQCGVVCFMTWRTWDSLPAAWVEQWLADRAAWLRAHGIDPEDTALEERLARLPRELRAEFNREFSGRWEGQLDQCHGACVLRRPELAQIVERSFRHLDGQRYTLLDFVVMPNHVHLLATFRTLDEMLTQRANWKRFTSTAINRILGRSGRFWQTEGFDHLVRSEARFFHFRQYIALNPGRAGLSTGECPHYSRALPE